MSSSSTLPAKPSSRPEVDAPVAQAIDKLQSSLVVLIDVLNKRSIQRPAHQPTTETAPVISIHADATATSGLAQKLSDMLGTLLDHIRHLQQPTALRVDDEIDASYLLEMN